MTEITVMITGVFFFALGIGFVIGEMLSEVNRKRAEIKVKEEPEKESLRRACGNGPPPFDKGGNGLDQMTLRNGYGVTRDRNPTFAEQWVNIMNYSGESQTEEGYEEENNNPEGYMG